MLQREEETSEQQLPDDNGSCVENGVYVLQKVYVREMTGSGNFSTLYSALLDRSNSMKHESILCKSDLNSNSTEELFQAEQSGSILHDNNGSANNGEGSLSSACISNQCEGLAVSCEGNHFSHTDSSADLKRPLSISKCNEGSYNCDQCNYTASSSSRLQNVFGVHDNGRPFNFSQCNYATLQSGTLNQHIALVHEKKTPFMYEECN